MKIGDAVRVKVNGQRRLERGLVAGLIPGDDERPTIVKVTLGLRSILAGPQDITVIHKIHEKETVIVRVTSLQRAARELSSHRGNKRLARVPGKDGGGEVIDEPNSVADQEGRADG